MPATAIKQVEYDPKREILDKLGDISGITIAQNEVLVAVYRRPQQTPGGIFVPGSNLNEDKYQGKAGLVLKIGASCKFEFDDTYSGIRGSAEIAVGDWVAMRPSDTWAIELTSRTDAVSEKDYVWCRLVRDRNIRLKINDPRIVW
jgi:co-chaperonin GroES (HSP10)